MSFLLKNFTCNCADMCLTKNPPQEFTPPISDENGDQYQGIVVPTLSAEENKSQNEINDGTPKSNPRSKKVAQTYGQARGIGVLNLSDVGNESDENNSQIESASSRSARESKKKDKHYLGSKAKLAKMGDSDANIFELAPEGSFGCCGTWTDGQDEFNEKKYYIYGIENNTDQEKAIEEITQKFQDIGVGFHCRKGLKPECPNQDNFGIYSENWDTIEDPYIFGCVMDGHGRDGHIVSNAAVRIILWSLIKLRKQGGDIHEEKVLKKLFSSVQSTLKYKAVHDKFDLEFSGCTGSVIVMIGGQATVAWIGDSRVIRSLPADDSGKFQFEDVSNDHKPELEAEKKRIESRGGEVLRLEGDIPHRVFKKGHHTPGLAMSRAFGDVASHEVGVISEPDVRTVTVDPDCVISLASDGVWEFISSKEAGRVMHKRGPQNIGASCLKVCKEARKRWLHNEFDVVDDITMISIYHGYRDYAKRNKIKENQSEISNSLEEEKCNDDNNPIENVTPAVVTPKKRITVLQPAAI